MSDNAMSKQKNDVQREAPSVRPAVDVFEDDKGIVLTADLPGVSSRGLNLQVDDDTLSIDAEAELTLPNDAKPLHAEVRATRYRRSFTISRELNADAIEAGMKNGVLRVFLPKRAEHQPRRIDVNVG